MPVLTAPLLLAWLALAPVGEPSSTEGARQFDAPGLDPAAVERGLRARLGDEVERWQIEVRAGEVVGTFEVEWSAVDRRPEQRTIAVVGTTDEDRSRELAATLALILLESSANTEPEPEPDPTPGPVESEPVEPEPVEPKPKPVTVPVAVVGVEGHAGLGPLGDLDPSLGVGIGGGVWVVRDILQPRVRVGWARSQTDELVVDGINVGAGLAVGYPLRRWWFGALVLPAFKWTRGSEVKANTALSGGGEVSAMVQYRRPRLVLGLRTGIETTFRPVRIRGSEDAIRWGPVRWMLALEIGVGIGTRIR